MIKAIIILSIILILLLITVIAFVVYIRKARKSLKIATEALINARYSLEQCIKNITESIDIHLNKASSQLDDILNNAKTKYNINSSSIEDKLTNAGFTKKKE